MLQAQAEVDAQTIATLRESLAQSEQLRLRRASGSQPGSPVRPGLTSSPVAARSSPARAPHELERERELERELESAKAGARARELALRAELDEVQQALQDRLAGSSTRSSIKEARPADEV